MGLKRTTPPVLKPVTLDEAKKQLEIWTKDNAHDSQLRWLIDAATEHAEDYTGRAIIDQSWTLKLDSFPLGDQPIMLPRPPLQSVTSVKYINCDGVETTMDAIEYQVAKGSTPGFVGPAYGNTWPTTRNQMEAVTVEYVAGYGQSQENVPAKLRQAILMLVAHWFEHREAVVTGTITKPIEFATKSLLRSMKVGTHYFASYGITN